MKIEEGAMLFLPLLYVIIIYFITCKKKYYLKFLELVAVLISIFIG